jgi:hypothetical protein
MEVETEIDLSLKQQFLDLVLLRKGPGTIPRALPDGFEDLAGHNLITFKSHQKALDDWTLLELIGHYVNYRKQASPSLQALLPESDFRLFAVCVRPPHNLAQQISLTRVQEGVYETRALTLQLRVIVTNELPAEEHNALLALFSTNQALVQYGKEHFQPRSPETSTLLYRLFLTYSEDPAMSDKLAEFARQTLEMLKELPLEKRLEGLSPEERLAGLSPEDLRKAVEVAQRRLQANGPSSTPQ